MHYKVHDTPILLDPFFTHFLFVSSQDLELTNLNICSASKIIIPEVMAGLYIFLIREKNGMHSFRHCEFPRTK